jgi:type IV secretory pathway protease TraF
LAVIHLPDALRALAAARGYLGLTALLIKPVAAGTGDVVCRHGAIVTIDGKVTARARMADQLGRPLPQWNGCIRLAAGQIFVLAVMPDSFDSRYVGPIGRSHVIGAAIPVWVNRHDATGTPPRQRSPP